MIRNFQQIYKSFSAFTLAEVLIVVSIVGLVAQITIPSLMENVRNKEFKEKFKKEYSVFSQVFEQIRYDNGGYMAGAIQENTVSFQQIFSNYFKLINYEPTTASTNTCWADAGTLKYLNGTSITTFDCSGCPSGMLADGTTFAIILSWVSHDLSTCNIVSGYTRSDLCFDVFIDVNGRKIPNTLGKDIYIISVYNQRTTPADWYFLTGAIDTTSCLSSSTGLGCSIKVLQNIDY